MLAAATRSLATAANVVRAIDAVSAKPETSSGVNVVSASLKQVASVETAIPNVHLLEPAFRTVIEQDLRYALDGGLDKLVLDAIAVSGFQAPGSDNMLVSIRKAITTIQGSGYSPDTLVLTPAAAESLDVMVSGISGGSADFVFAPGSFAPGTLFGLQRRISKAIPAPAVVATHLRSSWGRCSGRSSCSPPRPGYGRTSGSRSNGATSIARGRRFSCSGASPMAR